MINRKLPKLTWIRAYLNAHGWTEERQLPPAGTMYALTDIPGVSGPITVFVPSSEESPDYPLRVAEVVTTLAGVEDRPEGRVWADLSAPKTRSAAIAQMAPPHQKRTRTKSRPSTKATDQRTAPLTPPTLTVVFWGIRGSSRLTEQLFGSPASPAILTGFLADYFELARMVIQNHNGISQSSVGQGVMALFGHPSKGLVADDGAESAVLAALEFSDKFDRLAAEWVSQFKEQIPQPVRRPRLSCGIHTSSEVRVDPVGKKRGMFTAEGGGVLVAARVQSLAHKVPILVTETVHARTTAIPGWADRYVFNRQPDRDQYKNLPWHHTLYSVQRQMSS